MNRNFDDIGFAAIAIALVVALAVPALFELPWAAATVTTVA